ncbi:hypothetical protein [Pelagicoccus albus]|uniref:Uncharacterized protein n=1 Tax=Pelagicoccus albus TaxID=415222 RepID=A0A7X1E9U8_9BACT|nr:hypothetical protein [Pelagicoccus albus]MBC2607819.1 hypothetical protein [Pelagicoccus albus]
MSIPFRRLCFQTIWVLLASLGLSISGFWDNLEGAYTVERLDTTSLPYIVVSPQSMNADGTVVFTSGDPSAATVYIWEAGDEQAYPALSTPPAGWYESAMIRDDGIIYGKRKTRTYPQDPYNYVDTTYYDRIDNQAVSEKLIRTGTGATGTAYAPSGVSDDNKLVSNSADNVESGDDTLTFSIYDQFWSETRIRAPNTDLPTTNGQTWVWVNGISKDGRVFGTYPIENIGPGNNTSLQRFWWDGAFHAFGPVYESNDYRNNSQTSAWTMDSSGKIAGYGFVYTPIEAREAGATEPLYEEFDPLAEIEPGADRGRVFVLNEKGDLLTSNALVRDGVFTPIRDLIPEDFETIEGGILSGLWMNDNGQILIKDYTCLGGCQSVLYRLTPNDQSLSISIPEDSYKIGDFFTATIVVTSSKEESATVSFLDNKILDTPDSAILKIVEDDTNNLSSTFVLSEEDPSKTFEVEIEVVGYGVAELNSEVEAVYESGVDALVASEDVIVPSIVLSLRALPLEDGESRVNYELNEEGMPTDSKGNIVSPRIEVTVENLAEAPVNAVLQGLDPRARDKSSVLGRIQSLGDFPIELGAIAKGSLKTQEIALELNEDGRFEFAAVATAYFVDKPAVQFNAAKTGAPIAVGEPYPVKVEMEFVRTSTITNQGPETFFVSPGGEIKIIATVENLTTNSTLHFKGLDAEKRFNAFGSRLTSSEANELEPPLVHDHEVDADSSVVLSGLVQTDPFGAPTGTVRWIIPEDAYLIDDATKERTDLDPKDFLVETEIKGWLSDEYSLRIVQDFSKPLPPELTSLESVALFAGNFTKGTLVGMAKWTHDSFDAIGGLGRVAGTVSADPSLLSDALGNGSRFVWESAELAHLGWTSMSTAQKEAFILEVSDETWRRAQFLATAPFDKESYSAAVEYTKKVTYPLFDGVSEAYASDDPERIAELYGTITGNVAMEVITAYLPDPKFTRYVDGAELANLAKAADNIRAANTQQKILRSVPAGPVTRQLAVEGWGIGGKHLDDVQAALKELGMMGYARERAPRSIELSEVLDEAVLKPQGMKPKGFSDLDRLMLGNDVPTVKGKNGDDLDLDAITAVIWPPPDDLIKVRLQAAGNSDDVISAVLSRADARRKEYQKRFPEFKDYKENGIPIEFDYKSNDSLPINPNNPPGATRKFDYETIETTSGALIHVPKMGNASNELRYITGDVDWIHFAWLDGTSLDSATAAKLYELLERCCGLQHGETVTWVNKGQAVFEGKASQIGEYLTGPNQKALLEVTGNSIRAVRVRPNLTRFAKDARNHLIFFDGGTKSMWEALSAIERENIFAMLFERLPPKKVVLPFLWFAKSADFASDTTINGQEWTYSDDPDAILARQADDGTLERYDGKTWLPWDFENEVNGETDRVSTFSSNSEANLESSEGDQLKLTPTLVLEEATDAGLTELPVTDYSKEWADELEGHLEAWFEVGDVVIIAPGTTLQEIRKIVSLEPFTLDKPLSFSHYEDTVVAKVTESIATEIVTVSDVSARLDSPVMVDGIIAFSFELPNGASVEFQTSVDLENWQTVEEASVMGGDYQNGIVSSEYPGELIYVALDTVQNPSRSLFLRWRILVESDSN